MNAKQRDAMIETLKSWKELGIHVEHKSEITGYCLRSHTVVIDGESMSENEFAEKYPYAVNPSN